MKFTPDYVGMMIKSKDDLLDFCSKLASKYGVVEFSDGLCNDEITKWEKANGVNIPDDYKEWLKYSSKTKFPTITMELNSPSDFQVKEDYVIIGCRQGSVIAFSLSDDKYILIDGKNRKNMGHIETILRFWIYDMQKVTLKDRLIELQPVIAKETDIMNEKLEIAKSPESGVKEALEYYFVADRVAYMQEWGTLPKCPVRKEDANCPLIISEPDYDGYYQWQPVPIESDIDFTGVEEKLGFKIHKDIKALLSSYYHFRLEGYTKDYSIHIYGLLPRTDIERLVIDRFEKESYAGGYQFILDGKFFHLGAGCIGGDDSFVFEVDNTTGEVWAVEYMDKKAYKVALSIKQLLLNISPIWSKE